MVMTVAPCSSLSVGFSARIRAVFACERIAAVSSRRVMSAASAALRCSAKSSGSQAMRAAGCGALLVPFPAAVDDHQTKNGEHLVRGGAAMLVQESALTARTLAEQLRALLASRRYDLAHFDHISLAPYRDLLGDVPRQRCIHVAAGCLLEHPPQRQRALRAQLMAHRQRLAQIALGVEDHYHPRAERQPGGAPGSRPGRTSCC